MDVLKNSKLKVNNNIIIGRFRDNKGYILIKKNKEYFPVFLKQKFINMLNEIKDDKYGEREYYDNDEDLQLLLDNKLVVLEDEVNEEVNDDIILNNDSKKGLNIINGLGMKTRTPIMCKIEITYKCNYRCDYCYIDNLKSSFLKYEDIKKIIYKLKNNGVYDLFITGGEPFLHPNIYEIIEYCNEIGILLTIQTNGSFIDEETAIKLSKYNHLKIAISFHSAFEEEFDSFTKIKGSFRKTIDAIEWLKKYDLNFYLKHPVTKNNEKNMKCNIEFLEKNNLPFEVFCQILPDISDQRDTSCYSISDDSVKWLYKNGYIKYEKSSCSALKNKCWISPKGDFYPCELVREKIGNIITDDFDDLWNGEKAKGILESEIYREPEKCRSCQNKSYCKKCIAYLKYNSWNNGINNFCRNAEIVKELYTNCVK